MPTVALADLVRMDSENWPFCRATSLRSTCALTTGVVVQLTPEAAERAARLRSPTGRRKKKPGKKRMSWLGGQKDAALASLRHRHGARRRLQQGLLRDRQAASRASEGQMLRGRTHEAQVIGIGHQKSQGVKSGVVVDLDRAEHAIRLAVDAAERMAGLTVDSLIVNLTAGRLKSDGLLRNDQSGWPRGRPKPTSSACWRQAPSRR